MIFDLPQENGFPPFFVRLVSQGDRYGHEGRLTHHESDPLVELYDSRFDHSPWLGRPGQFCPVTRYYWSWLCQFPDGTPLSLKGGVPEWVLSPRQVRYIKDRISSTLTIGGDL